MDYEYRLRISKLSASAILIANAFILLPGGLFDKNSAAYAIMIFSMFILFQGLILCWHNRLFGTGRSVRLAMVLTMAICLTYSLSYGVDVIRTITFLAAAFTSILSIKPGKRVAAQTL